MNFWESPPSMNENEPLGGAARDASAKAVLLATSVPFKIIDLRRVAFRSKVAEFSIDTPIGRIEVDLFTPVGREAFVQTRSVRDKFTGQWRRTTILNREFAARVLAAVQGVPEPPVATRRAETAELSAPLLESEQRFEAELNQLHGANASGHGPIRASEHGGFDP